MGKLEDFVKNGFAGDEDAGPIIDQALETMRTFLGMEIAFLSEFVDDTMVLRAVRAPGLEEIAYPGARYPTEYVYCKRVCDGELPELIPDSRAHPIASQLPITHELPIGSHLSIPIHRTDGALFGTFCCVSREQKRELTERDVEVMRSFAALAADQVNRTLLTQRERAETEGLIAGILDEGAFRMVFQPIVALSDGSLAGVEALARFESAEYRPPNQWFEAAARVGLKCSLEIAAIVEALKALPSLPSGTYLSLNASAETLASPDLVDVLQGKPCEQVVLELTEHTEVADHAMLRQRIEALRMMGLRLAVDDAGAGYSGLQQILQLQPDIIKLDLSLTAGIDGDQARAALVAAMVHFAAETNARLVAEGIETEGEFAALRALNVHAGQGYFIARPGPLQSILAPYALSARQAAG